MSVFSKIQRAWLLRFGQPAENRILYRAVSDRPVTRLLEIGLGTGERTLQLLDLLKDAFPADQIHYCGIDQFEGRATSGQAAGMPLKMAYRKLKETGVKVQLLPGDPLAALARGANQLNGVELVVIAADQVGNVLEKAWFYLPRVLAANARVYLADGAAGKSSYRLMTAAEIAQKAQPVRTSGIRKKAA